MEEPALPVPDSGQSNPETGLLPESGELPARLPPEVPSKLSPEGAAPEAASKGSGRFDEIRSLAMNSPRPAYLLKRARHSSNSAARHLYLRAYYVAVASQMRKLDPNLKSSIETYEETQIHEVSGVHTSPARTAFHRSRVLKPVRSSLTTPTSISSSITHTGLRMGRNFRLTVRRWYSILSDPGNTEEDKNEHETVPFGP